MIFCLMEATDWESASGQPVIARPGGEGFVHCCDERQLASVRSRYFQDDVGVVALVLDPTLLPHETRYEPGAGGEVERFPHVYGAVERSDVVEIRTL